LLLPLNLHTLSISLSKIFARFPPIVDTLLLSLFVTVAVKDRPSLATVKLTVGLAVIKNPYLPKVVLDTVFPVAVAQARHSYSTAVDVVSKTV